MKLNFVLLVFFFGPAALVHADPDTLTVDEVWAGHPVGFDLYTTERHQYVCYYDAARNMVIAQRNLDSSKWKKTVLPTKIKWDSHNYVRMALDAEGYIHVSGNMHNVPLIYFRSQSPESIDQFTAYPMTGVNEERVTYPIFFKNPAGELYFQYRNGQSGQGITYWKKYHAKEKEWTDVFDQPLFDGEKEANAYMSRLVQGPDGYFYMVWMWRLTYIANTNHNLSCVRTKDFTNWETIGGVPLKLPLKWSSDTTIVDPVGPWNGLINISFNIGWDAVGRPCISYHKYDKKRISQVFVSRWEDNDRWESYQVSHWPDFRWNLDLGGSLGGGVKATAVQQEPDGNLSMSYTHEKYGSGTWKLDKETFAIREDLKAPAAPPQAATPGLGKEPRSRSDNTGTYTMTWETLPANRDLPRDLPGIVTSTLIIYKRK